MLLLPVKKYFLRASANNLHIKWIPYLIIFGILLLTASCDLTQPEKYYNQETEEQQHGYINFSGINDGQHYLGEISFEIFLDSLSFPLKKIKIYLDGSFLNEINLTGNKFKYSINTSNWPDGPHNFLLAFIPAKMGFYTLTEVPVLEFTKTIYFDNSIPEPVKLTKYEWVGSHPKIFWSESKSQNFFAYIIEKVNNFSEVSIDTIYDRSITEYTDTTTDRVIGEEIVKYRVEVSNSKSKSQSNILVINFGKRLPFSIYHNNYNNLAIIQEKSLLVNINNELSQLNIISASDDRVIKSINSVPLKTLSQSHPGDRLLISPYNQNEFLYELDLNSFELSPLIQLGKKHQWGNDLIESGNRLINFTEYVNLINMENGIVLDSINLDHFNSIDFMKFNPATNELFVEVGRKLYQLSLDNDKITVKKSINIPWIFGINIIPDKDELILNTGSSVLIYNCDNLNLISEYKIEDMTFHGNIYIRGNFLYGSIYDVRSPALGGRVVKINVNDWQIIDSWIFKTLPLRMSVMEDIGKIYVYCNEGINWVINL